MRWGKQLAGKGEIRKGLLLRTWSKGSFECFVGHGAVQYLIVLNNVAENGKMCKSGTRRKGLEASWRMEIEKERDAFGCFQMWRVGYRCPLAKELCGIWDYKWDVNQWFTRKKSSIAVLRTPRAWPGNNPTLISVKKLSGAFLCPLWPMVLGRSRRIARSLKINQQDQKFRKKKS